MNNNSSENNQSQQAPNNPPRSRYEERQLRREARRASRHSGGAWVGGALLIALGLILLFQNYGILALNNWWALFILLPAVGAFASAARSYQDAGGRLTAPSRASLIGGLVLCLVSAVFLFNLNWTLLGPAIIILAGIGILINAVLPS